MDITDSSILHMSKERQAQGVRVQRTLGLCDWDIRFVSGKGFRERTQILTQEIAKGLEWHPMKSMALIADAIGNNEAGLVLFSVCSLCLVPVSLMREWGKAQKRGSFEAERLVTGGHSYKVCQ